MSPAKAQYSVSKEPRFSWQVKKTSKVVSYSNQYVNSSFDPRKVRGSSSQSTFGNSKRFWVKPKVSPSPH